MMAGDIQTLFEVESMCPEALNAAIEVKLITALFLGDSDKMLEQGLAATAGLVLGVGYEIVDVEKLPPSEVDADAVASNSEDWVVEGG